MRLPTIDLAPLRRALALLNEALGFWNAQADGAPLKPHLRSSVIQSFEFTYEQAVAQRAAAFAVDAAALLDALEASLAG